MNDWTKLVITAQGEPFYTPLLWMIATLHMDKPNKPSVNTRYSNVLFHFAKEDPGL